VFVLCATNRPEALDPALTRPGRLDHLLRVPLPDTPARLQILASALRRCPLDADVALASLAEGTEGMSGADLAEVCRRAGMAAIRELVAAEEQHMQQMQRMQDQQQGSGGSSSCGSVATELATAPLQQRHLAAALASMRRSVTEEESQRHARVEQQLAEGSLPAPAEEQQEQQQVLRQVVQQAVQGSVERQLSKLQLRVQQLEAFVQGAGLELPPPAATP
jgi:transitional endoplasmic reticulum ATPase